MSVDSPNTANSLVQTLHWHVRMQGECVEVSRFPNFSQVPTGLPRGAVSGFSRTARLRMLRAVHKIDWDRWGDCVFITLTYPDSYADAKFRRGSSERWRFQRALEKHLGRPISVLWRVEWKARLSGARKGQLWPHLHLLCGAVKYVSHELVRYWWRTIVHVYGPTCTDVQGLDAGQGAALYVSKYTAKNPSLDIRTYLNNASGLKRAWGITRKHLVPWADVCTVRELSDVQAAELRSLASRTIGCYDQDLGGGFTLLGKAAVAEVGQILEKTP